MPVYFTYSPETKPTDTPHTMPAKPAILFSALTIIQQLPSAVGEWKKMRFVEPSPDNGKLQIFHAKDTDESPAAKILAIRCLTLGENEVIPAHAHSEKKEKHYLLLSGEAYVILQQPGDAAPTCYHLKNEPDRNTLMIPGGATHCVLSPAGSTVGAEILICMSSQDRDDIVWEHRKAMLLENKHGEAE